MREGCTVYHIITDRHPSHSDQRVISSGLRAFNTESLGFAGKTFAVFVKDNNETICGGILAYILGDSVYIETLWLSEKLRKQGYGSQLMTAAEKVAREEGCDFATVDTFGFQAEGFYIKNGYERIGEIVNYIKGHPRIFLRKKL
jgi:ribosomal protein S18 acetylase RimI-like enzyme